MRQSVALGAALCAMLSTSSFAAKPPDDHRNFIACPIVRDTSSVPCWLAEHEGELYFLTLQTDVSAPVTPPWLGHKVLVEGVATDEPRICGGIVLKPVVLSVLPEVDQSCNTQLPAEERYDLTFEPPRPPGPSKGRLAFDPQSVAAPSDAPTGAKTFNITFDFDGMISFRHPIFLMEVMDYAKKVQAKRIEIVGHRGATLLSNGETVTEKEGIARQRAQQIAELLQGAGLTGPRYDVKWRERPERPDGVEDHSSRRVTVVVKP
jgi:outer membrane protein OmpA-like peptidoglycan-associated protein